MLCVIPAQAGIQDMLHPFAIDGRNWIPACARMTIRLENGLIAHHPFLRQDMPHAA